MRIEDGHTVHTTLPSSCIALQEHFPVSICTTEPFQHNGTAADAKCGTMHLSAHVTLDSSGVTADIEDGRKLTGQSAVLTVPIDMEFVIHCLECRIGAL